MNAHKKQMTHSLLSHSHRSTEHLLWNSAPFEYQHYPETFCFSFHWKLSKSITFVAIRLSPFATIFCSLCGTILLNFMHDFSAHFNHFVRISEVFAFESHSTISIFIFEHYCQKLDNFLLKIETLCVAVNVECMWIWCWWWW